MLFRGCCKILEGESARYKIAWSYFICMPVTSNNRWASGKYVALTLLVCSRPIHTRQISNNSAPTIKLAGTGRAFYYYASTIRWHDIDHILLRCGDNNIFNTWVKDLLLSDLSTVTRPVNATVLIQVHLNIMFVDTQTQHHYKNVAHLLVKRLSWLTCTLEIKSYYSRHNIIHRI